MKKGLLYALIIIAMAAFYMGYNDGRNDKHKAKVKTKAKILNQSNIVDLLGIVS